MANKPLKTIKFPGLDDTYTVPQVDAALATSGAAADAKKVGDELSDLKQDYNSLSESKADKTANNPSMGAGYASQLVSSLRKSDSVPYNFRKVPYDSTLEDGSIVGASVAWNQIIVDPHTSHSLNRDSSRTYYLSTDNTACIIGHRYFLSVTITEDTTTIGVTFEYGGGTSLNFKGTGRHSAILKQATSVASSVYTGIPTSEASGTKATYTDVLLTDLTAMLGTTIADYVYSLETATAGSGVAWLKEHFPKQFDSGYQAYNAGEIKSISGLAAHKSIGFNAWNEVWEVGLISGTTGQNVSGTGIRSKNMNRCIPNTSYYYKAPGNAKYVMWYDADENFISPSYIENNGVVTSPNNATYFRLRVDGITTYSNDICINLSKPTGTPKNGDYVAYEEHTYALDSDLTLRGILKLDSNNKLYADGDVYKADGTVDRTWGEVDLGTLSWGYNAVSGRMESNSTPITDAKAPSDNNTRFVGTCARYMISPANATDDKTIVMNTSKQLRVYDSAFTDATAFTTAMSGVKVVYLKETPTTETASPYGNPQVINPDGTESYVYTDGAFELPVGHTSEYPVNVSGQLDVILDTPTTNGTYTLQATVTDGAVAYEWVSAT